MALPVTRVLTLLAQHGTERYANARELLLEMMHNNMPDTRQHIVVVDNSLDSDVRKVDGEGIEIIGASNNDWEFSAWDIGIDYVRPMLENFDLVLLATSAFNRYDPKHLSLIGDAMLRWQVGKPVALGHIDFFNDPVECLNTTLQAWLRSSFILAPPELLTQLGSLVSIEGSVPLFSGHAHAPFSEDAPISRNYQRYLLGWLTGHGTDQGIEWHSRFDLNSESLPLFESKAKAILNEQMMTQRLVSCGCKIADISWLAGKLRSDPKALLDDVPGWQIQLASRV